MKPPQVTERMIQSALSRCRTIPAQIVRQQNGKSYNRRCDNEFVKYRHGKVAFKKMQGGAVLLLYIPEGTVVHREYKGMYSTHRKCRTKRAFVIGRVYSSGRVTKSKTSYQGPYRYLTYKANEWVSADGFSERYKGCAAGLHFFETWAEAKNYWF